MEWERGEEKEEGGREGWRKKEQGEKKRKIRVRNDRGKLS